MRECDNYVTFGNIGVTRCKREVNGSRQKEILIKELDSKKGAYYCSSFEYPGRYTKWDFGFINPPVEIHSERRNFEIVSLNRRGEIMLNFIYKGIEDCTFFKRIEKTSGMIHGEIIEPSDCFAEEERSKQPSVFSLLRKIRDLFYSKDDNYLGFYGAYGYDLIFQFENIELKRERKADSYDLLVYIPDEIFFIDHMKDEAFVVSYDFSYDKYETKGIARSGQARKYNPKESHVFRNPIPGEYAQKVLKAKEYFKRGELFEVVPSHTIYKETKQQPSSLFNRLTALNPSPYGFFINMGDDYLIGSSPEMYVRVEGRRVETCPISGTVKRGKNSIEDAEKIKELLNSRKDESELTMCTDVDRNDKSRICVPGSVKVIGRRQIEMYSHLIHTVDHVEGILRSGYDSMDAFMTHMWAVTVTGAPKRSAVKFIEENEDSDREWYAGAVGFMGFDGNINTGLTLRTIHLKGGLAKIRVGATLLDDSVPEAEEEETFTKAAALIKALNEPEGNPQEESIKDDGNNHGMDKVRNVLFVDHEDSFVHTLAEYFRRAGANVKTLRHNLAREAIKNEDFDLVVLSPGPGSPADFKLNDTIRVSMEKGIPIFGVCLGMQGIIEYFGGELGILERPCHGKKSDIRIIKKDSGIFTKLGNVLKAGRYHSLYAKKVPNELAVTAQTEDGIVMAIEHKEKPLYAVQFHPESIMTIEDDAGMQIICNVLNLI